MPVVLLLVTIAFAVAFVVAPPPPDLQVARRVALALEAAGLHQGDGRLVLRLDVGFQPVQLQGPKGVTDR